LPFCRACAQSRAARRQIAFYLLGVHGVLQCALFVGLAAPATLWLYTIWLDSIRVAREANNARPTTTIRVACSPSAAAAAARGAAGAGDGAVAAGDAGSGHGRTDFLAATPSKSKGS